MANSASFPEEAKGLNWGGFLLGPIWGVFNGVWLSLLCLVIGPIMSIILLFKGNEWAWNGKQWQSVEEFKASQKKWAIAGVVILVLWLALAGASFVFAISQGLSAASNAPAATESAPAPATPNDAPPAAPADASAGENE
jgi:hypothetical protein